MIRQLNIKNDLCDLESLHSFLEEAGKEYGLDSGLLMNIKLAIEEAVVNIISYAYHGDMDKDICLSLEKNDNRLEMELTDTGFAFNPLEKEDPDVSLPLESRPIGGLGIFLVKELMTDVHYRREDNKNILTLIKELS